MRLAATVGTLAALILTTACAPDEPAPPPPTTSTSVTTTTTTTTSVDPSPHPTVAPPVTQSFDLRPHEYHVCELLTTEQLVALGLPTQPPPDTDNARDSCRWPVGVPGKSVFLVIVAGLDILGEAYAESNMRGDNGTGPLRWELFEPRTIAGQPAVVQASTDNDPLACEIVVGMAPDQGIKLFVGGGAVIDVCATGVAVAEQMVRNIVG